MTCQAVRNQLLTLPDPGRPGADVRGHLMACTACRQWQHRLLQIERSMPLLPVPPSTGRKAFLKRFLAVPAGQPAAPAAPQSAPRPRRFPVHLGLPRPWAYAAAAVAAVILVGLGSWALWAPRALPVVAERPRLTVPDPFVASLVQRNLRLAVADTRRERLAVLADLADDLFRETRLVARSARADDLRQLAVLYEEVVQEGIVTLARSPSFPAADRGEVLPPLAERLVQTSRDAERLARGAPVSAAAALRMVSAAARDGERRLHDLAARRPGRPLLGRPDIAVATVILLLDDDDSERPPDDPYLWQQLYRNRGLVPALVRNGLVLAGEEDPLRRADQCNGLARQLVDEIQQAVAREDDGRAAELGDHLHDLLANGVMSNLDTVRRHTPPDSTRHKEFRRVSEDLLRLTEPLEQLLQAVSKTDPGELRRALEDLHETRMELDRIQRGGAKK